MSTIDADSQAGPSTQRLVRPRKLTRCQKCKNFMYNKEEKTCMRRTGRQCLFLLMFYLLFHAISVAVFALFFYGISIETLGLDAKPLRRIRHSTSPCPTIVPTLFSAEGEVGIHYFKNDYKPYVKRITKFFRAQEKKCEKVKLCPFVMHTYGPCGESDYGYSKKKPCVFVKLNILEDFVPKAYKLHKEMPTNITFPKDEIEVDRQTIWVDCRGATPYDREHLQSVDYYPARSFNDEFFPVNMKGKVNPFVAVHLTKITPNRVITVECKLIGRNLDPKVSVAKFFLFVGD